jgi:competence protein ComEC
VRVPASLVAIPLFAGCCAGILLADSGNSSLPVCAAAAGGLSFVAALGFFLDDFGGGVAVAVAAGCLLAGVGLSLVATSTAYRPDLLVCFDAVDANTRESPIVVEGVLREDAAISGAGVSLVVDVRALVDHAYGGRRATRGGVRLTVSGAAAPNLMTTWRAGRTVRMPVLLRRPTSYRDPGVENDERGLARRGIVLLGTVKSGSLVETVKRGTIASEAAASAREWARRSIRRYVGRWSAQSAAIAIAILIGDRSGLSDDDERALQDAGTYHVIAISGGNVAILAAMLLFLFRLVQLPPPASAGLTIVALIAYGEIASGGASVSRAVTGACIYLGGRMLDHRGPPLNALAVAAVAGLAASPLAAFDGGFILSFGATLGILVGVTRLNQVMDAPQPVRTDRARRHGAPMATRLFLFGFRSALALFIATVCAEIALIPVSALLFSRITFAGLALNFIAIPMMAGVQGAALVTLAASDAAPRIAEASGYITHLATVGLLRSAALVEFAPWASQHVVPPAWWLIALYYGCCGLLLGRRFRRVGAVGVAALTSVMVVGPAFATNVGVERMPTGLLRVVFLDVGQGDSTLVRFPGGRAVLVDAGGLPSAGFDVGERVVAPALRAFGVRSIDTLVLTHGDPDHIGGAPAVVRGFSPRQLWEGVPVPPHVPLHELALAARQAGSVWRSVQSGDRESSGGVDVRVLHPPPPEWERQRVRNEDSVVIELRLGLVSIVLPGDIGHEAEQILTPRLATAPITIVKAPHHGSATSSSEAFIAALHPSAVIFSAGRNNRFGHPAPVVLARYLNTNCLVFRTDEDGAIVLDTDGQVVHVTTWATGRRVTLRR